MMATYVQDDDHTDAITNFWKINIKVHCDFLKTNFKQ